MEEIDQQERGLTGPDHRPSQLMYKATFCADPKVKKSIRDQTLGKDRPKPRFCRRKPQGCQQTGREPRQATDQANPSLTVVLTDCLPRCCTAKEKADGKTSATSSASRCDWKEVYLSSSKYAFCLVVYAFEALPHAYDMCLSCACF